MPSGSATPPAWEVASRSRALPRALASRGTGTRRSKPPKSIWICAPRDAAATTSCGTRLADGPCIGLARDFDEGLDDVADRQAWQSEVVSTGRDRLGSRAPCSRLGVHRGRVETTRRGPCGSAGDASLAGRRVPVNVYRTLDVSRSSRTVELRGGTTSVSRLPTPAGLRVGAKRLAAVLRRRRSSAPLDVRRRSDDADEAEARLRGRRVALVAEGRLAEGEAQLRAGARLLPPASARPASSGKPRRCSATPSEIPS